MTTQSIIVYRNPAEAAFWESGAAFPLMVAMVATVLAVVTVDWAWRTLATGRKSRAFYHAHSGVIAAASGIIAALTTLMVMM